MATTNKSKSDWITLLQQANSTRVEKIPKGFKPMEDWLKEFDRSESTWRRMVPVYEEKGLMTKGFFRVEKGGKVLLRPFWKRTPKS